MTMHARPPAGTTSFSPRGQMRPRTRRLTASQRAQLTPLPGHRPGRNNLEQSGRDFLPKPGNLRAKRDGSIDRVPRGGVGR